MKTSKNTMLLGVLFLFALGAAGSLSAQTLAFPTAEGFAKNVSGGRGGYVVEVTTLEDDPDNPPVGSLRWALGQGVEIVNIPPLGNIKVQRPLTIVFRVSGIIDLKGHDLKAKRKDLTIAGQTAPGDGICIKGGAFNLGGSRNVIVRHLRFRTGAYTPDGEEINAASVILENGGRFIFDHCSFSWSAEELCDFADGDSITVQWCIFSEGLYQSVNGKGARGYGPVIAGAPATYHHNLIASCVSRAPRFGVSTEVTPDVLVDFVNNVNYNFGKATSCYGGENEMAGRGTVNINFRNNYYKQGPAYPNNRSAYFVAASFEVGIQDTFYSKWHLSGNYIDGSANAALNSDNYRGLKYEEYVDNVPSTTLDDLKSDAHYIKYPIQMETAQEAFNSIMEKSGAFPRDAADQRVVNDAINGTASVGGTFNNHAISGIIDRVEDAGGYPEYATYNTITDKDHDGMDDAWEVENGLNPDDANDRNRYTKSGYTCLEVYLNSLVGEEIEVEFPTGTKELESADRSVKISYSSDHFLLESSKPIVSATLFDMNGKMMREISGASLTTISKVNLPHGIYILTLNVNNERSENLKCFID